MNLRFENKKVLHFSYLVSKSHSYCCCHWHRLLVSKPQISYEESLIFSPYQVHPPGPNCVKLNFDGSVASNHNDASDFVICDELGSPLLVGSKSIGHSHVPVAKARAVRDVLCSTLKNNFSRIQVEGDSKRY